MATKTTLFIAIVTTLVIGGQATAQSRRPTDEEVRVRAEEIRQDKADEKAYKDRARKDSPDEREARRELERAIRNGDNFESRQAKAKDNAGLTCQSPEAREKVYVDAEASRHYVGVTHSNMTIVNQTDLTIRSIKQISGGQAQVNSLCPHGSLSITQTTMGMYDQRVVRYLAEAVTPEGEVVTDLSPVITIYSYGGGYSYGYDTERSAVWNITFDQSRRRR